MINKVLEVPNRQLDGPIPELRHRKLGYLHLDVTDIEASTRFATDVFGLDLVTENREGARFFRSGSQHHDIIFTPAARPALGRSSWELENDAALDAAYSYYSAKGRKPKWVPENVAQDLRLERAFRVVDPVIGKCWEYYAAMTWLPGPRTNPLTRFEGGKHFGLVVPDCRLMSDHLVAEMGFQVSDYIEGWQISLLRAWPNPNHHSVATVESKGSLPRIHHVAFMVQEIDDIGRLFSRAKRLGAGVQWGIGRHPTSGSIHLYIYGPDEFVWEYTLGMEQFPPTGARPPRRMSAAPEDFDLWDAMPDISRSSELPIVRTHLAANSSVVNADTETMKR